MELINEVPPIKVEGRIVACEGGEFVPKFFFELSRLKLTNFLTTIVSGCRHRSCTWAPNRVHMPRPEGASYMQVLWPTLCSGSPPLRVGW